MTVGARHAGPADVVALHRFQQAGDVRALEAADVVAVVDVARRRRHQDELAEALGLLVRREHPDHAAHGMPDEDDIAQIERLADIQHILRVAVERAVTRGIG